MFVDVPDFWAFITITVSATSEVEVSIPLLYLLFGGCSYVLCGICGAGFSNFGGALLCDTSALIIQSKEKQNDLVSIVQSNYIVTLRLYYEGHYPVSLQLRDKLHSPGVMTIF